MTENDRRLRETLQKIAEMASAAVGASSSAERALDGGGANADSQATFRFCVPKALPDRLLVKAADVATRINPVNAPALYAPFAAVAADAVPESPLQIAVRTSKYWGPAPRTLTVSFMESTPSDLRTRIVSHLNAWSRTSSVSFAMTNDTGDVRISRGPGGYYSYLGTDILLIPRNRQTMNLESFTMQTSESEFRRVVRHEAGHTLGFPHEHMRRDLVARIDRAKAYQWFYEEYGWDETTVDQQVLTPLDEASLMATLPDQTSIMCYQLPGAITRDGEPIRGGDDINATDYEFAAKIYPKAGATRAVSGVGDWAPEDDVEVAV